MLPVQPTCSGGQRQPSRAGQHARERADDRHLQPVEDPGDAQRRHHQPVEAPPRQRVEPGRHVGRDDLRGEARHAHVPRISAIRRLTRLGRSGCILSLLVTAACGQGDRAAFVESAPPPGLAERFHPPQAWAWGEIQVGDAPVQRYGVASASGVAKAQVLILPDYGESAETWFETARDLSGAGYVVWVLEGVGQGGSGRLTCRRDLGELASFDTDVAAARAMIDLVIRPHRAAPADPVGRRRRRPRRRPRRRDRRAPGRADPQRPGLPGRRARRRAGVPRPRPVPRPRRRRLAARRPGRSWRAIAPTTASAAPSPTPGSSPTLPCASAARRSTSEAALARLQRLAEADLAKLRATPTLVIQPGHAAACLTPSGAQVTSIPGAAPALELEATPDRAPWLTAVNRFTAQTAARLHPTPGLAPRA